MILLKIFLFTKTMAKFQKRRNNDEEIQPSTSNGRSNYEKLLEEAVIAQKSLKEFENIQQKLNQKIQILNNQINTQQNRKISNKSKLLNYIDPFCEVCSKATCQKCKGCEECYNIRIASILVKYSFGQLCIRFPKTQMKLSAP